MFVLVGFRPGALWVVTWDKYVLAFRGKVVFLIYWGALCLLPFASDHSA